jgi:hypothetical protein
LLSSYNLYSIVHFPIRIQNNSISAIDNIFIDLYIAGNYTTGPLVNELSEHEVRIIYINNINLQTQKNCFQNTMNEFMIKLSHGTVFLLISMLVQYCNSILNTHLRIFCTGFPKKKVKAETKNNPWMTRGVTISCRHKKELY